MEIDLVDTISHVHRKAVWFCVSILSNGPGFCHLSCAGSTPVLPVQAARAWTWRPKVAIANIVVNMSGRACSILGMTLETEDGPSTSYSPTLESMLCIYDAD